jgi:hypothetical protein
MTEDDVAKTARLLRKFEPGFLPYDIFIEVARLVALPILEIIPLRLNGDVIEVLVLERPENDMHFAGMLHTPGTVIRATDVHGGANVKTWAPLSRIIDEELMGTKLGPLHYVGSILHKNQRGAEQAQLYWTEIVGDPKVGKFWPVDALPDTIIGSQKTFIRQAVKSFTTIM